MVLLLDEAHAMDVADLGVLLNVIQRANKPVAGGGGGGRLLAVLAGTPGLRKLVRKAVSYSERFTHLDVGLLDRGAAIDALRVPLEEGGLAFDRGVLEHVAEDAQCYPYFLQLWGEALWDAAHGIAGAAEKRAAPVADEKAMSAALQAVEKKRSLFYSYRYEVLCDENLLWAAIAVSRRFVEAGVLTLDGKPPALSESVIRNAVLSTVAANDADEREGCVARTRDALVEHGFIWKAEEEGGRYLPGIPSLMSYVLSEPVSVRDKPSAELDEWVSRFRARAESGVVSAGGHRV